MAAWVLPAVIAGAALIEGAGSAMSQSSAEAEARAEGRRGRDFAAGESALGRSFQSEEAKKSRDFTAEQNALNRLLQEKGLDFSKTQFKAGAPQRSANVMATLLPYQGTQDKKRFADTAIKHIGRS